tara:strand:- start:335 stop:463 length:129 start_codon:yes stop_codon:yes gene_type:complete
MAEKITMKTELLTAAPPSEAKRIFNDKIKTSEGESKELSGLI